MSKVLAMVFYSRRFAFILGMACLMTHAAAVAQTSSTLSTATVSAFSLSPESEDSTIPEVAARPTPTPTSAAATTLTAGADRLLQMANQMLESQQAAAPTPIASPAPTGANAGQSGQNAAVAEDDSKGLLAQVGAIFSSVFDAMQGKWFFWLTRAGIGFVVLIVILSIWRLLSLRSDGRRFVAHADDQPSVDERLLSELAPLEVALLRGSIDGYYEKVGKLTRQLLKSRNLLDTVEMENAEVVLHLQTLGVDAAFLDCVESLFARCEAVSLRGERPKEAAHYKLRDDLATLIRMNPFAVSVGRKREKKTEKKTDSEA